MKYQFLILADDLKVNLCTLDSNDRSIHFQDALLEEVYNTAFAFALYSQDLDETILATYKRELAKTCLFNLEEANLSKDKIFSASYDELVPLFQKILSSWVLKNNLKTIEDMATISHYFKDLWKQDPDKFFNELWQFLKDNLGAQNLQIIYNDVKKGTKENEKDRLIQCSLEGPRIPEKISDKDVYGELLGQYKTGQNFELQSFEEDNARFVASGQIDHSPILLMANVHSYSLIQNSLLKGLFKSLNH